jgi:hypothetical protein
MDTRRVREEDGKLLMFEIDRVYISKRRMAALVGSVPGASDVAIGATKEAPDARVRFVYGGRQVIVEEPYGDNSVYWIGATGEGVDIDLSPIERAFAEYEPPTVVRWLGDVLSLKFLRHR